MAFKIGSTSTTTDITALATPLPLPKSTYQPYARVHNKGNGGTRGVGSPVASWQFAILSIEEYNQLKTFCTGASAHVWIQTKLDDDTYDDFECEMIWPNEPQDRWFAQRKSFTVIFRNLVAV